MKTKIERLEKALERVKNCKNFRFEIAAALDDCSYEVLGYHTHYMQTYDHYLKAEFVQKKADRILTIEKLIAAAKNTSFAVPQPDREVDVEIGDLYTVADCSGETTECKVIIVYSDRIIINRKDSSYIVHNSQFIKESLRTGDYVSQDHLDSLARFAKAHGYFVKQIGQDVRVNNKDGFITTNSMNDLQEWMGY